MEKYMELTSGIKGTSLYFIPRFNSVVERIERGFSGSVRLVLELFMTINIAVPIGALKGLQSRRGKGGECM